MKALLLAAGLGTRLKPITNFIPKCLVPINGKPLLEYWLENLTTAGITEFLINTHYFNDQIEDFISSSKYKSMVTLIQEDHLLNTAGTILENRTFLQSKDNEPFMVIHADNLCFCDFKAFIDSHMNRNKSTKLTMMLFKTDYPSSCGIVEHDKNNVVQKFHEKVKKPPSNLANGAVYICEQSLFTYLESFNKKEIDFSLEVLPHYIGRINTFLNDIYHRDIGTLESYSLAQIEIKLLNR